MVINDLVVPDSCPVCGSVYLKHSIFRPYYDKPTKHQTGIETTCLDCMSNDGLMWWQKASKTKTKEK